MMLSIFVMRFVLFLFFLLLLRNEPSRLGLIVCQLQKDYIVKVNDECEVDEVKWLKINSGWICSRDSNGSLCYMPSHEVEASKFWATESVNRRRVASAISQLLAKGHSLTNARRVATLLLKQSSLYVKNLKPLTNLPDVSIEDLVIALTTSNGLKATEIFEFMKVAASQQSDPPKSLSDMAAQINDTMNLRPSLWVKQDLGVLDTVDVVMKNDIFVMACARNDIKKFNECLAKGQELAAIHSELKYTGLHAAADFGAKDIVERLLLAGISPNVRDARHGRTALHFAAQSGRCEIASLLLEKGADRSLADFTGSLPCEIADDQGHAECREILKQIPPEIQYAQVTHCTDKSITIQWVPPVIVPHLHAKVDEFLVIHEPVDKKNGAGQSYSTTQVYLTVEGLSPSTGHGFVVMSHSVSGWSQPSGKLIHFTLPAAPSAPSIVEMVKVTKNGILITWQAPENENGGPVDLYQIEMTDKDMLGDDYSQTNSDINTTRSLDSDDDSTSLLSEDTLGAELQWKNGQMMPRTLDMPEDPASNPGQANNLLDGKWHRIIRHRDVSFRSKYVMGLETYRNYFFRCACRNEFGWSPWSSWSGPYTPQEGVQVRQFGDNWIKLGWVEPQLAPGRKIDCFEIQMSTPTGPMSTSITVYKSKSKSKGLPRKSGTTTAEFKTLSTQCETSEYIARGLKSGKKYQFRARPKINNVWVDWDHCVLSDVITMPSSAPDAPQNVHVIRVYRSQQERKKSRQNSRKYSKESVEEETKIEDIAPPAVKESRLPIKKLSKELAQKTKNLRSDSASSTRPSKMLQKSTSRVDNDSDGSYDSEDNSDEDDETHSEEDMEEAPEADDESEPECEGSHGNNDDHEDLPMTGPLAPEPPEPLEDGCDLMITHNSIDIEWVNGIPNGSAILECEVQCCKVREYCIDDLEKASAAAGKEEAWDDEITGLNKINALNWITITQEGKFLTNQSFRAQNLLSGVGYIFRLRQRNDVHWSSYSRATPIITTLLAAPPMAPDIVMIAASHVVIQWQHQPNTTFNFSGLEYQIHIAKLDLTLPSSLSTNESISLQQQQELIWYPAEYRSCDSHTAPAAAPVPQEIGKMKMNTNNFVDINRVIIDNLLPMTYYTVRIKMRTVAGWTSWSELSSPFRTLALP